MALLSPALALIFLSVICRAAPGGIPIDAISDEFATLKPMWGPGLRGIPESLTIQNGVLSIRSVDNGDDPYPSAEDMICTYANQIGRSLDASEKPSVVFWVWLPPFAEWPVGVNASGSSEWFGLRVTAYDASLPINSGLYWPGIYVATDGSGPCLIARVGDGYAPDTTIGRINAPGWWTLGLSWNGEGRTEYYAAPGRVTLTGADLLYTPPIDPTPEANRSLDQLDGTFLALRMTYPSTGQLSTNWMVDAVRVYVQTPPSTTDFNGDGRPDYLLFNATTSQTAIWNLNGPSFVSLANGPILPAGWSVIGMGDFNNDGKPDLLLFRASDFRTYIYYMNGPTAFSSAPGPTLPAGWSVAGLGDFNGDGKPDLLLFRASDLRTYVWYLNGPTVIGSAPGPTLPAGWSVGGLGDFNGDGKPDLLLFHASDLRTYVWYMNGTMPTGSAPGPTLPAGWTIAGTDDFNRDGKPDLLFFRASDRRTYLWYMNGFSPIGSAPGPTLPAGWTLVAP